MSSLTLRLSGVMQSWGKREPWTESRRTEDKPTVSAIYGMLGCAFGIHRGDDKNFKILKDCITVDIDNVKVAKDGEFMVDDQTVHRLDDNRLFCGFDGKNREGKCHTKIDTMILEKEYLVDGDYEVTLYGSIEDIEQTREALLHPVWPYYLGRYCCIPSKSVIKEVDI